MSIYRLGEMQAQPGQEEALRAFLLSVVRPGVESSAGCQSCQVFQNQAEPTRFTIIETWDSQEAHQTAVTHISPAEIERVKQMLAAAPTGAYYAAVE